MSADLEEWLARRKAASAAAIEAAISATHLTHERAGFGFRVTPSAGSVLASPVSAQWNPDPDYFYHWARDAGVVMATAPLLRHRDEAGWQRRFADYCDFSLAMARLRGPATNPQSATTAGDHQKFLRDDCELAALSGDAILGEPRVNADGTVDFERWGRPQFDGPALRALSLLAWDGAVPAAMAALLAIDLDHALTHAAAPSLGPWEEEPEALYGFTLLAQRAALRRGADRLPQAPLIVAFARIEAALEAMWCEREGHMLVSSAGVPGQSDASIVLGALLDPSAPTFGIDDPRIIATVDHIEGWSRELFPVATATHPLVGRWPEDVYFGGNPWLPTSLGFAEYYFRRSSAAQDGEEAARLLAQGEAFLAALARLLPDAAGFLPEQLDRTTGAPTSSRNLTWSHAAVIAAAEARRQALTPRADAGLKSQGA